MAPKDATRSQAGEGAAKDRKRAPEHPGSLIQEKPDDFTSHGVTDNDVFILPSSDFQLLGILTFVAALVRLFRIYQPSSVVFDEVQ